MASKLLISYICGEVGSPYIYGHLKFEILEFKLLPRRMFDQLEKMITLAKGLHVWLRQSIILHYYKRRGITKTSLTKQGKATHEGGTELTNKNKNNDKDIIIITQLLIRSLYNYLF